jgi:hypothetical protein
MRARARSIQNLIYINSNVDTYDGLYYPDFAMSPEVGIHLGKKFFLGLAYHYVAIQNNHFIAFKLGWDF